MKIDNSALQELIEKLRKYLQPLGYEIRCRAPIRGLSGSDFICDVAICRRGSKIIALLFKSSISSSDVFNILAARMDTESEYIVVANNVEEEAKELLTRLGINVIQGCSVEAVVSEVVKYLQCREGR